MKMVHCMDYCNSGIVIIVAIYINFTTMNRLTCLPYVASYMLWLYQLLWNSNYISVLTVH